eukprot:7631363-Pyramimonas_sp.AAC.1
MTAPHRFGHTHHTLRGPTGRSTEGPSGCARMTQARQLRHSAHTFRGPVGSSTESPSDCDSQ